MRDLVAEAFAEIESADFESIDSKTMMTLFARAGRNYSPALLVDAYFGGKLLDEALPQAIGDAWTDAEFPEEFVSRELWLEMFDAAGFTRDGVPAPSPKEAITLYRGAPEGWQSRMAWTDDLATAEWFAHRVWGGNVVWTTAVPAHQLLMFNAQSRGEREWVIDPTGLTIERVGVG